MQWNNISSSSSNWSRPTYIRWCWSTWCVENKASLHGSTHGSCKVFEPTWRNMQGMGDLDHNEKCNNTIEHYCSPSEKLSRLNVFVQSMDVYINHIWVFLQVSRFCSPMCMILSWSSTKVCMVCTQTLVHWNMYILSLQAHKFPSIQNNVWATL